MSRRRTIAIGSLALVLLGAPFLPDGDTPPAIETAAVPAVSLPDATAGTGAVTPAMREEIESVLAEGRTSGRLTGAALRPAALVRSQVRCADFEAQRYCLGVGWTAESEQQVVTELARSLSARTPYREETGDLPVEAQLRRRATLAPAARERADRAELTTAAASVAKVWLLRHQVQGVPLPSGFLARHPEVRTRTTTTTTSGTPTKTAKDYPQRKRMLRTTEATEQTRSYWCGPASLQMITWGWSHTAHTQRYWAHHLGTTTAGSSISDMVRLTNHVTGWDQSNRAGTYVVLDIKDWSYRQWYLLQLRHIYDYKAPVILHPVLLKKWYPYLDDNASGHFQVGRGFDQNGTKSDLLRYFEPWNQQRFDPSEPYIARDQLRSAYRSYRANREHFQHNIGV